MIRNFLFSIFFFSGIILILIIFLPALILPQKFTLFGGKLMGYWAAICLKIFLSTKIIVKGKENLIKNLKYSVELADSGKYEISSNLSQLIILNGIEVIFMKDVSAIFTDKNNKKVFINSNNAEFNSDNYNTLFTGNIRINYEDNLITSEKLHFNFIENNILVYENVVYKGLNGKIQTDNIKINLLSKNIEIFMNEKSENVKIISF